MTINEPEFFKNYGSVFALGYYDARTSGASRPSENYFKNQTDAYGLGFTEGTKDKITSSLQQKLKGNF